MAIVHIAPIHLGQGVLCTGRPVMVGESIRIRGLLRGWFGTVRMVPTCTYVGMRPRNLCINRTWYLEPVQSRCINNIESMI